MTVLRKKARKHGLTCLLHEKPFHGINGSGKHINYSIGNAELGNLFDPGETPHENAQFLVFLCAVIRALHKHAGFLRASVATASNDLRLGAHEAPPAVMSLFLGDQLTDVLEQFRAGQVKGAGKRRMMNVGVDTLPPLPADPGDRNRTSPFAFVGNRFEFRALGAASSAAGALVVLNAMMTESLDFAATFLEKRMAGDSSRLGQAVRELIEEVMEEHSAVIFNGDGYSEIWQREAERRGLPNYPSTPDALPRFTDPEVVSMCERYGIFSRQELKARQDIYLEQYVKTVRTEANLALRMARTQIYPAVSRYQRELADSSGKARELGINPELSVLKETASGLVALDKAIRALEKLRDAAPKRSVLDEARYCQAKVLPAMRSLREVVDGLEMIVADDLWPLPSYQEMLFMK